MSIPLWCLLVVALLPYPLAFLGGYCRRRQLGRFDNHHPRAQYAEMTGLGARVWAAQQNAWEALIFFTAAVVAAEIAGVQGSMAAVAAVVFVIARVLHALCYIADWATPRSLIFVMGFVAGLTLFGLAAL
ncbi:MAPEG family protein [Halomonas sp. HP20-15]|uniref:MAPEG family protein n=1 Tax=Halomonas sp. HP20-15 TaxID=3085901 RepID=UPI0029811F3D|nr:MAPEG family protein [Halomonas sp. HP20-15]MDW5376768.1 MAPEG family protein [Halomonas sp. HP20-15]